MKGHGVRPVGRADELETLVGLLEVAAQRRGRVVVVAGEGGIGKTTLVEALAAAAEERGTPVAWGWCTEAEAPAFWPWRQLLANFDAATLVDTPDDHGSASERAVLFARVVDTLAATDRPALVVLEDVHWADPASLALLRFVVDAVPGLPVLVVITMRDDPAEATPEANEFVGALPAGVERMVLSGLSTAAVAELITRILGSPPPVDVATRIAERCGGNPFFVEEVARLHTSRGAGATPTVPLGVRQVLGRRLARLSSSSREFLATGAVAGALDVDLLSDVNGVTRTTVLRGLNEAVTARLLLPDDAGLRFAHALVRETVYEMEPHSRRAELHRRIAEVWERRIAQGSPEADVAAGLANHWGRADGPDARASASKWALVAARAARERMGYEQAVRWYGVALEQPPDDDLPIRIELGESQILSGALETGRETLRDAARDAARHGRAPDLARAALGLGTGVGGFEVDVGDDEQVGFLRDALDGLGPAPGVPLSLRAAVQARLAVATGWAGHVTERSALASEAVDLARAAGDHRTEVAALAAWCDAHAGPADLEERLVKTDEMLNAADRSGDPISVLLARRLRVVALGEVGDFAGLDDEVAAYARTADRLRLPLYAWYVPMWRGTRALMAGDFDATRRFIGEVDDLGARADSTNAHLMAMSLRLWLAWFTDDVDGLAGFLSDPVVAARDPYVEAGMGGLLARIGELDRARRSIRRVTADRIPIAHDSEYLGVMWPLADGVVTLEEHEAAEVVYQALEPYADCWVIAGTGGGCCGQVAHQLGRLACLLGRFDQAGDHLNQALAAHRAAGATLLVELTEAALEELARTRGSDPEPAAAETTPSGIGDDAEFRRSGWGWQLRWNGVASTVPDLTGMGDVAQLLATPGREVHVLDLVEAAGGPPAHQAGGHLGPRIDDRARSAYRHRLTELEEDLADAEADHDAGRIAKLRAEQQFLAAELAGALGLGERPRLDGDPAERARKAVHNRIRRAIKAIAQADPALGLHLDRSVTTGRFCAYRPEHPVRWQL